MTIEITKQIGAPPEQVFAALTDAQELNKWWTSSADSDPRTGGEFAYRFEFDDESRNHIYSGAYEDVTPNERVRFPWNGRFGETTVEFVIRPSGAGAELALSHTGWSGDAEEARQMHVQGWTFFLDNLERYLTGGEDERAGSGQKTGASAGAATTAGP